MALDVPLLRSSFALVADKEPEITARFYDNLFAMYPESMALFATTSMENQQDMLLQALVAVVDHLDEPDWLVANLAELGGKHVDYGVTPEMYEWVGAALLRTLGIAAGPAWSPELQHAWFEAYSAIASLMLAGVPVTVAA